MIWWQVKPFLCVSHARLHLLSLLVQLRPVRQADFEETIKEFSAKLSLVPLPPPGQLHVVRKHSLSKHLSLSYFRYFLLLHSVCICLSVGPLSIDLYSNIRFFNVLVFQPPSPPSGSSIKGGSGQACYRHRFASTFPLFYPYNTAAGNAAHRHYVIKHQDTYVPKAHPK